MYKIAFIGRYLPGISLEEGRARWSGAHAPFGAAVPGVERYVQSHPIENLHMVGTNDQPTKFDGYACIWFTDKATFEVATASPEWAAMIADAAEFLDVDWTLSMSSAVEENLVIDGDMGPFKAVWICRFKDEIRADAQKTADAHEYWKRTHGGAYGVKVPGIDVYIQNHNTDPLGAELPAFDGFSECWFADRAAFEITMNAPEWDAMNGDAFNLFDVETFIVDGYSAILDEIVIKG